MGWALEGGMGRLGGEGWLEWKRRMGMVAAM